MSPRKREYIETVGRRKEAVARVRLSNKVIDALQIEVNEKDFRRYFTLAKWQDTVTEPLKLTGQEKAAISVRVSGGGVVAQAQAARLAIARALIMREKELRPTLKKAGMLTVDQRIKERKKPGLKKARRAPQWSKR